VRDSDSTAASGWWPRLPGTPAIVGRQDGPEIMMRIQTRLHLEIMVSSRAQAHAARQLPATVIVAAGAAAVARYAVTLD
jgi:hypothetical protein